MKRATYHNAIRTLFTILLFTTFNYISLLYFFNLIFITGIFCQSNIDISVLIIISNKQKILLLFVAWFVICFLAKKHTFSTSLYHTYICLHKLFCVNRYLVNCTAQKIFALDVAWIFKFFVSFFHHHWHHTPLVFTKKRLLLLFHFLF